MDVRKLTMANTCFNNLRIYGDGENFERLVRDLDELYVSKGDFKENCNQMWIGRLMEKNGVSTKDYSLRASITYYDSEEANGGGSFSLDVDSAWGPPYEWMDWIEEEYDGVGISYKAEEFGCGLYETNDIEYFDEERFVLTFEGGYEYFSCRADMEEFIKKNEIGETDGFVYELEEV